jgi:hypothetical protein
MSDYLSQLLPEERLLLSLSRLQFNEEQKRELGLLIGQVTDWDRFVALANEHGIIALCWYNLVELRTNVTIQEKYMEMLHAGYLKSLARNTQIFELLKEVLAIATREKIKVILLKGLALERSVYGMKGLRQMNDLDILVESKDAIRLRKLLLKNGFESQPMISSLHEKILPAYGKHLPEMYKDVLSVEIHFKLFDEKDYSLTRNFISSSILFPLQEGKRDISSSEPCFALRSAGERGSSEPTSAYRIPHAAYHFLYLVKHLQKHESGGTSQLRLYTDLAMLLSDRKEEILNDEIFEYAKTAGIERALAEKIFLLDELWGAKLPIDIPVILKYGEKQQTIEKFIHFLRYPKDMRSDGSAESLLKPLKEFEGLYPKVLFIVGYLFPSITFMKYRYSLKSGLQTLFYYPVRWAKLINLIATRSL